MKKIALLLALSLALSHLASAQGSRVACTELQAFASTSPPQIRLEWTPAANASGYLVYRKAKNATLWGFALAAIPITDSAWTDTTVAVGEAWEYRLEQTGFSLYGNDYIYAGLETPAQDYLGKAILVIDTTYYAGLESEMLRFEEDLWGDGWQVVRLLTDRNDVVDSVKNRIRDIYNGDPLHCKTVVLLGHVPVPYSGNIAPDGHSNHVGAWPADVYYGEMDGTWTDATVNNTSAARPENDNVPADGKFDQNSLPSELEMNVGRIDMANMPAFAQSEEELLRHYLDKDHAWRHKEFSSAEKGVVDENFNAQTYGYFGASGFRNFGPLVGAENVTEADYRSTLNAQDVMWSYGCGGGTYTSAGGIGSTTNFVGDSLRGVFTMLFGSYHGDWDSQNNFMRASLANKGTILSCAWAGRPAWYFHHMGLGTPIGHSMATSTNFLSLYSPASFARMVHIALMGDPALRMHILAPPANLVATPINGDRDVQLTWTASPDSNLLGYHIYRQDTLNGRFWQVNTAVVTASSYTDACLEAGTYRYLVRAVELRTCRSGSYYNLSQGAFDTVAVAPFYAIQSPVLSDTVFCPEDSLWLQFSGQTPFCDGNVFVMELSDGNGNFGSAVTLGTDTATFSNMVLGEIPSTMPGTGYLIRLRSTTPPVISDSFAVTVLASPVASFTVQAFGDSIQCTNNSSGASSSLWDFGDGNSSAAQSPGHVYASSGSYTVSLTVTGDCGSSTSTTNLTVVGLEVAMELGQGFKVWPNPTGGRLFLQLPEAAQLQSTLVLRDLRGLELRRWSNPAGLIDLDHLPESIYLLELRSAGRAWREKIVLSAE